MDKNTKKIISLTEKLISFKTIKDNYKQYELCLNFVDSYLEKVPGLKIARFKKNRYPSRLYYFNKKNFSRINLNGHLDVVAGKDYQFKPFVKNNKLYGRGAFDMKAACAVFIDLFRSEYDLLKKADVSLMLVCDEELTGKNGTKHILDSGFRTNFCINGEPTELKISKETKSSLYLTVDILGKQAHSSRPWLGKNPIYDLNKILKKLLTAYPEPKKPTWGITVSLVDIKTVSNGITTIPEKISLELNVRFPPYFDKKKIIKKIQSYFKQYKVFERSCSLPIFTKASNIYIGKFRSVAQNHGLSTVFRKGFGTADMRFYNELKIPGIGFGIDGGGGHSDLEYLDIDSISVYEKVLKDFFLLNC